MRLPRTNLTARRNSVVVPGVPCLTPALIPSPPKTLCQLRRSAADGIDEASRPHLARVLRPSHAFESQSRRISRESGR